MKIYESNMTEKEVQKISKAYASEISSSLFYFILSAAFLILFNTHFTEKGFLKYALNIAASLFGLYQLKKCIHLLFFNGIRKDFTLKRKIKFTLTVIKKTEGYSSLEGASSPNSISFKKNPYFWSYNVSTRNFDFIHVGDKVHFEISKFGKWVVKVTCKKRNIEFYPKRA